MKQVARRSIRAIFIASVLLIAGAFAARAIIVEQLLIRSLGSIGGKNVQLIVGSASPSRLFIRSFSGCFEQWGICLQAKDLKFSVQDAFYSTRRIQRFKIENVIISALPSAGSSPSASPELNRILDGISFEIFPSWIEELSIDNGKLLFDLNDSNQQVSFTVDMGCKKKSCRAKGVFNAKGLRASVTASQEPEKEFRLSSEVRQREDLLAVATIRRDATSEGEGTVAVQSSVERIKILFSALMSPAADDDFLIDEGKVREVEATENEEGKVDLRVRFTRSELQFPLTLQIDNYGYLQDQRISFYGEGLLIDNFETQLEGELKFSDSTTPVHVTELTMSPTGDVHLALSIDGEVAGLPARAREFGKGATATAFQSGAVKASYETFMNFSQGAIPLTGKIQLSLNDVSGVIGPFELSGVNLSSDIVQKGDLFTSEKIQFAARSVNSGVVIEDLRGELTNLSFAANSAAPPKYSVDVRDVVAEVFGGDILVQDFSVQSTDKEYQIPFQLSGISLEKICALYGKDALQANGVLNGDLPVVVNKNGVSIAKGWLNATEGGGKIQIGESLVKNLQRTPGMDIAARALKDYHFKELSSALDYFPNGQLRLQLSLKGTSPALNTTRPVHVNLNVEQNVLELLKSLRIVQNIENRLR